MSLLKLYSVSIVFGILAALRFEGIHDDLVVGSLLTLVFVGWIVAEKERQRLVRLHRGGYRRRKDDD